MTHSTLLIFTLLISSYNLGVIGTETSESNVSIPLATS